MYYMKKQGWEKDNVFVAQYKYPGVYRNTLRIKYLPEINSTLLG